MPVNGLLRFVGIFNAAIWLGGAVFFSFLAGNTFFQPEVVNYVPPPYNGLVAQAVMERYFLLHYICGIIALIQLTTEWLYSGSEFPCLSAALAAVLLCLALGGGKWISPRLNELFQVKYSFRLKTEGKSPMIENSSEFTATEIQEAKRDFALLHGVSMSVNLLMLGLLAVQFWRASYPPALPHFTTGSRLGPRNTD